MRSALVTACMLLLGTCAPAAGVPEAVGLLLSLALLSGAAAAPSPAISQRQID
jgi:hypothetical protein